jgi:hypothetical protein
MWPFFFHHRRLSAFFRLTWHSGSAQVSLTFARFLQYGHSSIHHLLSVLLNPTKLCAMTSDAVILLNLRNDHLPFL